MVAQNDNMPTAVPDTVQLEEATVKSRKEHYSRKNNPAVELMRQVIAAKDSNDWRRRYDYTSVDRYSKLTMALNDVPPEALLEKTKRRVADIKSQVERCPETGKLIMPLSMTETMTRQITRRTPATSKDILLGQRHSGIEDLFDMGETTSANLMDVFTEVNIMDDDIRLFQHQITSPLSRRTAISFYHYHIVDTIQSGRSTFYDIFFTPANNQDLGFTGRLLISADSTYQILHSTLALPKGTGVNWIENLVIEQSYTTLPTGERVLSADNMVVELRILEKLQKFQVKRTTQYSHFSTEPIASREFRRNDDYTTDVKALRRTPDFWTKVRSTPLSRGEAGIEKFKYRFLNTRGMKPLIWLVRAFATNSIPLTVKPDKPSYVDLTPITTLVAYNPVEGWRLRLSASTTANLMPHVFLRGYAAYGFGDKKWKGMGEVTYAFNHPFYAPHEFPVHNLTLTYQRDLAEPGELYSNAEKSNIFNSLKWAQTHHMMYFERFSMRYEREWKSGLGIIGRLSRNKSTPAGNLTFTTAGENTLLPSITTADIKVGVNFRPGATYYSTKQRRHTVNSDAPLYSLTHTTGIKGVWGSQYRYNLTEAEIYRRVQLNSWGCLDIDARGGIQWNQVPYPLLSTPASNLSYIKQPNTFALINNMEFLNDRYASLMVGWDLKGKLFNRIPGFRKLKWREFLGVNVLWGMLSHKNNPANIGAGETSPVLVFPSISHTMNPHRPYVEGVVGIHNIFRILHVEYVHRFTYNELATSPRWGIRFRIDLSF